MQVAAFQDQAWPADGDEITSTDPVHDPALRPLSMLLVDDGQVISALDILSKELAHDRHRFAASGISTKVTDHMHRGKGFGRILAEAARQEMESGGADLAIFTCDAPIRGCYEAAGFTVLADCILVGGTPADPLASDRFDKVTLARFFTDRARRAVPSFEHARSSCTAGAIDKLW